MDTKNKTERNLPFSRWGIAVDALGSIILCLGLFCYFTDSAILPALGKNNTTLGVVGFGSFLMAIGMADFISSIVKHRNKQ